MLREGSVISGIWRVIRNALVLPTYEDLARLIALEMKDAVRVVELGCGDHSPVAFATSHYLKTRPMQIVAVDIWLPYLKASRDKGLFSQLVAADILCLPFPDKTFDIAFLLAVVEHFEKGDALAVLKEAERITRKAVVVYTHRGFVEQGEADGNPYQRHRSSWEVAELQGLGFDVRGHAVSLPILRQKLGALGYAIGAILELLLEFVPVKPITTCANLYAIKRLS
jgi:SAM-dependent methyltransferase